MLNIAHRGASGRFPENTLSAFHAAIEAGADLCELDVQLSHDAALVVIHDDTVDRTTDGSGAVSAMTLAELKRLDAGIRFGAHFGGERIPTLDEVFTAVRGRCGLNIELKAAGVERRVCDTIRANGSPADVLVSSFDWHSLGEIRRVAPAVRVGLLGSSHPTRMLVAAGELGADAINPRADLVSEDLCVAAHQRRLNVYTWTVDKPTLMSRLIAWGVDGIMTNYPERLRDVMGR